MVGLVDMLTRLFFPRQDELYFKEGEVIVVLSKETEDDGWWVSTWWWVRRWWW